MKFISRAATVGVLAVVGGLGASVRGAPEIFLQPISASGSHSIVGQEIRLTGAGQRVVLHVRLKGWSPLSVRTYQAKIDAAGYASGASGTLVPAVQACAGLNPTGNATCAAAMGTGSRCSVDTGSGFICEAGFIDKNRTDYIFFDLNVAVVAVDISNPSYRYTSVLEPGAPVADPGQAVYGGTLVLDVPAGAQGTFTVGLLEGANVTLMADDNNVEFPGLITSPARIVIQCSTNANCNDNNLCTSDTCNTISGVCSNAPNYNLSTQCCNPTTGQLLTLSDGLPCTSDVCDVLTGQVTHPPAPEFTPCGNPANSQCDHPDSCNAAATCVTRMESAGVACGSATVTDCNLADTCNGAGACQANLRPSGFACGSPADTACDNPDTCNGIGICLLNNEADNTACSDGLFCTTGERCQSAVCTGGTPRDCADLLTCTDDSCNEGSDSCDEILQAGKCLIDGVCYLPGDLRPGNTCEECNPTLSTTSWSFRSDTSLCNDGDACTGTGRPGIGFDTCTGGICTGTPDPECNDDCDFAVPVIVGVNTSNNANAGADDGEASCQPDSNNDVWFKFTADCDGVTFASTTGSALALSNDTILSIYSACPGVGGTELACDDDSGVALQSALNFVTTTGTTYWIRVAGFEDNKGDITLTIRPVDDCLIDGVCYADGDHNPDNDCQACIPEISSTQWSVPRPEGSVCGNILDTLCDSPDACDGAGFCEVNYKPDGTVCADEIPSNVCTLDLCQFGACTHPPEVQGLACGDQTDNECDGPDVCDGNGFCDTSLKAAGVACGSQVDDQCEDPDFCDGAGVCLDNLAPDGTFCDDVDACTGGDVCVNGLCVGVFDTPAPTVLGISAHHIRVTPQVGAYPDFLLSLEVTSPTYPCLLKYVFQDGRLVPAVDAYFQTAADWGGIVVHDVDIYPSTEYSVRAACGAHLSPAGLGATWKFCDIDNDDDVDGNDIAAIVSKFRMSPGAVPLEQADMYPCDPDGIVNGLDVAVCVNAFRLMPNLCSPPCH